MTLGNPLSAPANDCVLFVQAKLAFEALLSGTVRMGNSSPIFIFGAVNKNSFLTARYSIFFNSWLT